MLLFAYFFAVQKYKKNASDGVCEGKFCEKKFTCCIAVSLSVISIK